MNKLFLQHRTTIILAVLSVLIAFTLAIHYGLTPLPRWASLIPSKTVSVTAVPLGTTNKPVQIVRTGTIESPKSAPVQTEFSGTIAEIYVKEGQPVKADQPLVKILRSGATTDESMTAPPTYQNDSALAQAQLNYEQALKDYTRFQNLYDQGAIPKRQLDTAQTHLQIVTEILENSKVSPQPSPILQNSISSSSNNGITIHAPNPGIVTGLSATIGKTVGVGQQLMILDVGEVQTVIHVEQQDLYLLHAGTQATIEVAGQTIAGQVASIYPEVGANNIPSFRVNIKIPTNTGGLLKQGMSVNVSINTGKSSPVRTLPAAAILQGEQGIHYIYLIDNGKALRQEVTLGQTMGNVVEITSTLPEQILIVTNNLNAINQGDNLTVE